MYKHIKHLALVINFQRAQSLPHQVGSDSGPDHNNRARKFPIKTDDPAPHAALRESRPRLRSHSHPSPAPEPQSQLRPAPPRAMPPPPTSAMEKQQQLQAKEKRKYPIRAEDYELFETVGLGVSATVQRARCLPFDEVVAIKILDFERHNSDLNNISREAQTMILIDHPNVLNAHCSFVNGHDLWVVMPFMSGGSCLHIMKSVYPDGFEEVIIATVLRDVLRGLEYLHNHGHIHRDVKAGNILVDTRGGVKLGDFGVSACLFDCGDRQRMRNTFVGTPCWMAPEVMEPSHGYDFKADIWSFGITALELAHGHAPFSRYPPMKVLLMTLQNAPPGLDYESDRKFSKSFKQMIAMCLVKNPSKRPSATKLLKQPFFKQAKGPEYLARKILEGLPTLGDRYQALKDKEENLLAQKKIPDGKKEELSQNEYKRGISSWNFDIEDLKAQASLIPEHEDCPSKALEWQNSLLELDTLQEIIPEGSCSTSSSFKDEDSENRGIVQNKPTFLTSSDQIACYQRSQSNGSDNEPKHACLNDQNNLQNGVQLHITEVETSFSESRNKEMDGKQLDGVPTHSLHERRTSTSSFSSDQLRLSKIESFKQPNPLQDVANCNGAMPHTPNDVSTEATPKASKLTASNSDDLDDKSKPPVVQQRGRFKVTSENLDLDKALPPLGLQKSHSMQVISQACASLTSPNAHTSNLGGSVYNQLHYILQTNILQRDNILNLMKQLSTNEFLANRGADGTSLSIPSILSEKSLLQLDGANEREKDLIQEITDLQLKVLSLQSDLQKLRTTNAEG